MQFPMRGAALGVAVLALLGGTTSNSPDSVTAVTGEVATSRELEVAADLGREFTGRSGALRVRLVMPGQQLEIPLTWLEPKPARTSYRWTGVSGTQTTSPATVLSTEKFTAPTAPGVYDLELSGGGATRTLSEARILVQVPFTQKKGSYLGGYFVGRYPTEGKRTSGSYAPPPGFIKVTRDNQDLRISEHFSLREFLTHDQKNVWPKYVVVSPKLLDKLELVMSELNAQGIKAEHMIVMSGYRTPQYNRQGLGNGRAVLSRHQYGDAADVWVDNNGDWYMDDLNRDGKRNTGDARVMLRAVERVEAKYPQLTGGAGIYRDNGAHGPFIHIDTRGNKARW